MLLVQQLFLPVELLMFNTHHLLHIHPVLLQQNIKELNKNDI
jgi:hypothetical protein